MTKKYVHIYQCRLGDIVADDIYDNRGFLITAKSDEVDERILKKLNTSGIRQLCIHRQQEEESNEECNLLRVQFKKRYKKNLYVLKNVLSDIAAGKSVDIEKINGITNLIYSQIDSIADIIECINEVRNVDEYTYTHSINVSIYALLIAKWLRMTETEIKNAVTVGLLHDIGKLRVPRDILNKKGPLLPEEYEKIKEHAEIGYHLSLDIPELTEEIRDGILMHHEREDGKGYPLGIDGKNISRYAKIVAIADVYDALTSERVYKNRITPFDTFKELTRIGFGYFDTEILMTFLSNISRYYVGSKVKMNNGESGKVIFIGMHSISTPIVHVKDKYIDLSKERQYKIVDML